jgi:RNA polymerase sigma-B factor
MPELGVADAPVRPTADPEADALFARLPDEGARAAIVARFAPLARHLARRFRGRAELEDLEQVGLLALLKAIDRYDGARGPFVPFASATIVGELKRHLRDTGWALRVPRRLQEIGILVGRAIDQLVQELGRSPTVPEVAARTGLEEDEVLEALEVGGAYRARSLDAPTAEDAPALDPPADDDGLELVEVWADVADRIRALPDRERRILYLRFFRNLSQSQIAERVGLSQMHVSRLLTRTLARLREDLGD